MSVSVLITRRMCVCVDVGCHRMLRVSLYLGLFEIAYSASKLFFREINRVGIITAINMLLHFLSCIH